MSTRRDIAAVVKAKGGERITLIGFVPDVLVDYDGESDVTGFVECQGERCCATLVIRWSRSADPNPHERVWALFEPGVPVAVSGLFARSRETGRGGERYRPIIAKIEDVMRLPPDFVEILEESAS